MKKRLLAIATLMLALLLISTAVFASNRTVPMQRKALDVPYEEVSVADRIDVFPTGGINVIHGAAYVSFDFTGLGEQKGERTLMVSVDNYNVVNYKTYDQYDYYMYNNVPVLSREITCGWDASLDMYGDPVANAEDYIEVNERHKYGYYLWNYDHATMRVIIREGNDVLGYALINFSDMYLHDRSPEWLYDFQGNCFESFEIVKAVMFMKDGEPYRGVTMDEVNALLDEAAISANKAENAEDEAVREKETEDDSILPEDDAVNKGDDAVTSENASKITENESEDEIEGDGEGEAEGEPEDGDNAGRVDDNGEDEDTPISSSRRED